MSSSLLAGLVLGVALGLLIALGWFLAWRFRYVRAARRDAVLRSQAVTVGKVFEQLVPYLPDFPFNPKDARFVGSPVDFVVFDGLSDGAVRRVVFVEVKTGGGELSTRERRVRDAVERGRVEWEVLRVASGDRDA
ncbi:MAG TPA: Holliday junction resolvase-like protein [Gemmatimonadales bacterium]|nr:Holliday junction resolvase-like protein [Gemmatimonadales bacterium]